jgi:uncharacterized protein (TIGR00369 family)
MTEPAAMTREDAQQLLDTCDIHKDFGLALVEWHHGHATFTFRAPASVRAGDAGLIHGGAPALDTAACFAVIAAVGVDCSTIDLRTDFLRPAGAEELSVVGTCLRAGRRFAVADANVIAPDGKLVATARGTFTW